MVTMTWIFAFSKPRLVFDRTCLCKLVSEYFLLFYGFHGRWIFQELVITSNHPQIYMKSNSHEDWLSYYGRLLKEGACPLGGACSVSNNDGNFHCQNESLNKLNS